MERNKNKKIEIEQIYKKFNDKFNWKIIYSKEGKEFLNYVFLGEEEKNSLAYFLEYDKSTLKMGTISGGSAFKYFLYYSKNEKTWKTNVNGLRKISDEEAIYIGNEIKKEINYLILSIETMIQENNVDFFVFYEQLNEKQRKIIDKGWFLKYLHLLFPNYFSTFYSQYYQEKILDYLKIKPCASCFMRNIQINEYRKKEKISNVDFKDYVLKKIFANEKEENEIDMEKNIKNNIIGKNVIIYGVPGSGKSYLIKEEYLKNDKNFSKRIVFHSDYTYSDFIGQLKPFCNSEDKISYKFHPGPFTRILKESIENPDQHFFLIIEEINRGNAPTIFGDIFQLLDRNRYGESEYSISNEDIADYVFENKTKNIKIPPNLTLIGTMNTSDQNAYTLDTAFQRRWSMRLIENRFNMNIEKEKEFANTKILDTTISWKTFLETINSIIVEDIKLSEDKRLGKYFIHKNDLVLGSIIKNEKNEKLNENEIKMHDSKFAEKVIKYLWDDVFKFSKDKIFNLSICSTLEQSIKYFTNQKGDLRFNIFNDIVKSKWNENK